MQLERHMTITTDHRFGSEWYVADEVNQLGIEVGTGQKEPSKIPAGEYWPVTIAVGEFDTEICRPADPQLPIVIK